MQCGLNNHNYYPLFIFGKPVHFQRLPQARHLDLTAFFLYVSRTFLDILSFLLILLQFSQANRNIQQLSFHGSSSSNSSRNEY